MALSKKFVHNIDLNKISKLIYNIFVATVTVIYSMYVMIGQMENSSP
jgi:hypothetical protein